MKLHMKSAHVISLRDGLDDIRDILIENGKIVKIGVDLSYEGADVIDARGLYLAPGLVDLFATATEPEEDALEDIHSLSKAAAKGGYTAVCVHTGLKQPEEAAYLREKAEYAACDILPAAAAIGGREILNYGDLKLQGVRAIYEDEGVDNPQRMRDVMFRARKHGLTLMSRCRDRRLYGEGLIREGDLARLLELPIIPASAEAVVVARDIILARESGSTIHLGHISTAASVQIIRIAKANGASISCSTEPHYLSLSSKELEGYNTLAKLDPPLGNPADIAALVEGLADGTIDCVASGHTPVGREGKYKSLVTAECGTSSLETALSVMLTYLYHTGKISLPSLLDKMTAAPAQVLGLDCGRIREGDVADLVLFDPNAQWQCKGADFISKGKNTPFEGKDLKGRVVVTLNAGRVLWDGRS